MSDEINIGNYFSTLVKHFYGQKMSIKFIDNKNLRQFGSFTTPMLLKNTKRVLLLYFVLLEIIELLKMSLKSKGCKNYKYVMKSLF
jgi:hypothetical protein